MIQFTYAGNLITIEHAGIEGNDTVMVQEPQLGYTKKYIIIGLGDVNRGGIDVRYILQHLAANGQIIHQEESKFNAFVQENLAYFYYLQLQANDFLGERVDKMLVNGLLIDKYQLSFGCYGSNGQFYQPLAFTYQVERSPERQIKLEVPATYDEEGNQLTPLEPAEYTHTGTLTINVTDGAGDGYLYKLGDLQVQTEPVFTDVPKGTYQLFVTSPLSMPCIRTITI